jgi:hypothetical protein
MYASGVNFVLALEFLEMEAWVRWICREDIVSALGLALGISRQIMKQTQKFRVVRDCIRADRSADHEPSDG